MGAAPQFGAAAPFAASGGQPAFGTAGQPVATPQPGVQAPAMGMNLGAGGVRLSYDGGDFSAEALKAAVFEGRGFGKPRLMGAAFFGLAVLFAVGNVVLVMVLHRFYPYFYSLAAIFAWGGLWLLITGQPAAQANGEKAPMWGRIGLGACVAVGILIGIAMIVLPWESMLVG
jgi:hypothetical protein